MLKGARITLREMRKEDLPRMHQFANDIEVELAGGGDPPIPKSLEKIEAEFEENAKYSGSNAVWFAIEADDKMIGSCGLRGFSEFKGTCNRGELGITIGDKAYWGRGYGREAIGMLVDYGFRYWNLHRIWLNTTAVNERAIRCYLACGFIEEGRLRDQDWHDGKYVDVVCMGILRNEWEQTKIG